MCLQRPICPLHLLECVFLLCFLIYWVQGYDLKRYQLMQISSYSSCVLPHDMPPPILDFPLRELIQNCIILSGIWEKLNTILLNKCFLPVWAKKTGQIVGHFWFWFWRISPCNFFASPIEPQSTRHFAFLIKVISIPTAKFWNR